MNETGFPDRLVVVRTATDVAVADPAFSEQHGNIHYAVMKRHVIEVRFSTSGIGQANDVPVLLRQVADAANREMPYAYRLDVSGDDYALVPTRTRNSNGDLEDVMPLLDRNVTIPVGTRSIAEHTSLMTVVRNYCVRCSYQKLENPPTGIHPCNDVTQPQRNVLILKADGVFRNDSRSLRKLHFKRC